MCLAIRNAGPPTMPGLLKKRSLPGTTRKTHTAATQLSGLARPTNTPTVPDLGNGLERKRGTLPPQPNADRGNPSPSDRLKIAITRRTTSTAVTRFLPMPSMTSSPGGQGRGTGYSYQLGSLASWRSWAPFHGPGQAARRGRSGSLHGPTHLQPALSLRFNCHLYPRLRQHPSLDLIQQGWAKR